MEAEQGRPLVDEVGDQRALELIDHEGHAVATFQWDPTQMPRKRARGRRCPALMAKDGVPSCRRVPWQSWRQSPLLERRAPPDDARRRHLRVHPGGDCHLQSGQAADDLNREKHAHLLPPVSPQCQ